MVWESERERPWTEEGRAVGGSDGVMGSSGSSTRNGSGTSGSTTGGEATAMSELSSGGCGVCSSWAGKRSGRDMTGSRVGSERTGWKRGFGSGADLTEVVSDALLSSLSAESVRVMDG